jgi:hypothetical protein
MTSIAEKLSAQWHVVANVLLGIWLAVSPWVLDYAGQTAAAWNASMIGLAIALVSASALLAYRKWEDWIIALLAAWLMASPYILGFGTMPAARWTHFVVGVLVAVLALWSAITAHAIGGNA